MTVTVDSFYIFVDGTELGNSDPIRIENLITQLGIETNNYCGLPTEELQDNALSLHVAHYLEVERQDALTESSSKGLPLKKIESYNEKTEWQPQNGDRYSWDKTTYGERLQRLINIYRDGAIWINNCNNVKNYSYY